MSHVTGSPTAARQVLDGSSRAELTAALPPSTMESKVMGSKVALLGTALLPGLSDSSPGLPVGRKDLAYVILLLFGEGFGLRSSS